MAITALPPKACTTYPFQWGSKRTGPDLARVGDRYSDEWHVQHLVDPRSVVPDSIMPRYAFLWALRSGQFEDLDGAARRILDDDEDLGVGGPK